MSRLRTLLRCFLMLALPFQGFAAAAMVACGLPNAAPAQMQHHGDTLGQAKQSTGAHDVAHHMHGEMQLQADAGSQDFHPDVSAGDHKCSVCSVCHAAALLDTPMTGEAHALPEANPALPARAMASLAPTLPDKPPRA